MSAARCRPRTPATRNIPAAIATITIDVPMSGWMKTSTNGTKATPHIRIMSWALGNPCFSSDRLAASMMIKPILANSDGVTWKPADLEPALRARRRRAEEGDANQQQGHDDPGVDEPGVDLEEAVVERGHREDEDHAEGRGQDLLVDA